MVFSQEYVLVLKASEETHRWHQEQRVLRLQLEGLQAEWDAAEQDLVALYALHVAGHLSSDIPCAAGQWGQRAGLELVPRWLTDRPL